MKYLKNSIPILSLSVLASLRCQAEPASDPAGRAALQGVQEAGAQSSLDLLANLLYFDAHSVFWLLVGGGIVAALMFPAARKSRKTVAPAGALKMPAEVNPATNGEVSGGKSAGGNAAHSRENWIGLDEATTVTVEELTCIEEEAEVFLMAGRPDVAIKVCRDYLDAEPDSKPNVWFKLLDIYHVQNMRAPFDCLAQEIRTRFNVALPTWEESIAEAELRHGLEHFPSLLANVVQHWNKPSGLEYLRGLMRDNRHGERLGFHEEAFRDLLMLSEVLEVKMEDAGVAANKTG
jgi:hypothetical protein